MKTKKLALILTLLALIPLMLLQLGAYAQLSGNYTINNSASASSSNYKNWASVASDLISGSRSDGGTAQGPGVSGPVTFTVSNGIYSNTQVKFTAISGVSSTNTITFKSAGGDSTTCVLQYPSGTTATDDYVLMLDGADFIKFHQIGFERTGTYAYYTVIQLLNTAHNNSFTNCWLKTRKVPSSVSAGWTTGVGAHFYFAGNADSTIIQQNHLIYGYNGVYAATSCYDNLISKNVFDTLGCIGTYMTQQTRLNITGNTYNMGDFGSGQGHYISYAIRIESSPTLQITKNKIFMMADNAQVVRGIVFVSVTGTAAAPNIVNNNWILNTGGTSSSTGISMYGITYLDLYYNNFLLTSSLAAGAVIHHNSTYTNNYVDVKNNNLINKGGGMIYDFPSTNGGLDTVTNNNCYVSGSVFGKMNSSSYSSLSAWVTGTGKDVNSINVDPGYVSNYNLHVSNIGINGKAVPYFKVHDDIDGESRHATTPDIGADEFFPIANDAGISTLDSPTVFCAGYKNVRIKFQNYGSDTLKNLEIHWQINGNSQTTYNWSGIVVPGNSSNSIILGNFNFLPNTAYQIKVWSKSPNNNIDGNNQNDTLLKTIYAGMIGSYTIGNSSGTDFLSFNNAITAMTSRGICGPVSFQVYNGIYYEQITLAALPGMGAANPVIFESMSGDSTQVVIQLPSSTATGNNNAAVQLTGANYVTFKGMTFLRTGTNSISEVVHILNNAHHNTFTNCQMINTKVTTNNATGINIWSDQSTDNYNSFLNNYVKFGTYNMLYLGVSTGHETGTIVQGNVFDSAYSSAVQIAYNDGIIFKNNRFGNSMSHVASNYELQLSDCDSQIQIMNNYFYNGNTDFAIYQTGCDATSSAHGITANNFISKSSITGVLLDAVNYQDIVFNSMYFSGTGTTNSGISTTSGTSSNIVMKNNNIVMEGGYVFNIYSGSQISGSDHNNLKNNSSQFAYWGTTYTSLASLISASGKDANSVSVNPQFNNSTDLHIQNIALKGAGEPILGVTTDIDGEIRDLTTPDIGADEFPKFANDAGILELTSPPHISCEGSYPIEVVIKNFGTDSLKSAKVDWKVNGTSQNTFNWSGTLASMETDTFVIGNKTFYGNTNPSISIWTSNPNGLSDPFLLNDSLSLTLQIKSHPTANAGSDKDLCIGDSVLIGPAPTTGFSYRWWTLSNSVFASTSQVYVMPSSNTSYVFEITDIAAGCSSTDTLDILIQQPPNSSFSVNNSNQCLSGNNFIFTNNSSGAVSYFWEFGDSDTSTTTSPSHNYKTAKTYSVLLTAYSNYGCHDTFSAMVHVMPKPVSNFNINNVSQCFKNQSFIFTNTSSGQTTNHWDFGDTTFSNLVNPVTKTYQFAGTKNVKLVTTNSIGCSDSVIKAINVWPDPLASFTVNSSDQCFKFNNFIFTNQTLGTNTSFWDFGDSKFANSTSPSHSYSLDGSFTVILITTSSNGCKDTTKQTVNVWPQPKASFSINKINQCLQGNKFDFTNSSTGINSYTWAFGDGSNSTLVSPSHSYLKDGSFYIKLISTSNYGCKDSNSQNIHVYPNPVSGINISDSDLCLNSNFFDFTDNSSITSGSVVSYYWDFGNGQNSLTKNPKYSFTSYGDFTVKHITTSNYGCKDTSSRKVTIYPSPNTAFTTNDTSQCIDNNLFEFTNTSSIQSGTLTYFWDFGDGKTSNNKNTNHIYDNVKSYKVTLVATSNLNCTNEFEQNIIVNDAPVVDLGEDDTIYNEGSITLDAGSGFDTYLWSNNAKSQQIVVDSTTYGTGTFTFWVKVTKGGCDGFDTILISILKTNSFEESTSDFEVSVYPNPVSNMLTFELPINTKTYTLTITDIFGQQLINIQDIHSNQQIDVSTLAKGVYFLNIDDYKTNKVIKIVKY